MGMTIEENIATLKEHLNTLNADKGVEFYQEIESIQSAIETMRKYQKIQEILNSASYVENGTEYSYTYDEDSRVKHIREVVDNGNDLHNR